MPPTSVPGPPAPLARAGLVGVVLMLTLAGCAGGSSDPTLSSRPTAAEPSVSSSTPSATGSLPSPTLPAGTQRVIASEAGVAFAAPKAWIAIDRKILDDPNLMKEMVAKSGQSEATLRATFTQMEVFVAGPATAGFAPNINVIAAGGSVLPPDAQIRAGISPIGEVSGIRTASTALGEVRIASYTATFSGTAFAAQQVYCVGSGGLAIITVSAKTPSQAAQLTETVRSTLQRT